MDMTVLAKPKAGKEEEFWHIWRHFQVAAGRLPQSLLAHFAPPKRSLTDRLLGRDAVPSSAQDLAAALQKISVPAYQCLGAPVVGQDAQADAWLSEHIASGAFGEGTDPEALRRDMQGYRVLELLPPSDGLPVYSNGAMPGSGQDRTSFRGAFLEDCKAVVPKALRDRAWQPAGPDTLAEFGTRLRARAASYAAKNGVPHVIGQRAPPDPFDPDTPVAKAHIVDACGRWCQFWGAKGHGMEPDY
ncbi:hypothetical protein [Litorivita sp. NS0012-18]|uniref:hypothetical protein n=1 Tax=Litorivita sp. NS0012-18 TaxID=3127655 RepID=UPI003342ADC1